MAPALILVVLATGAEVVQADSPRTNLQVADAATEILVERIAQDLPDSLTGRRLYLQPKASHDFNESFQDAVAPILQQRGFDVWLLEPGESPAGGSTLVEYDVHEALLSYPGETRGFLSLSKPSIRRRVVLDLGIRVQDVDSGLVIRSGAPRVQSDDRFAGGDLDLVQAEMPSWAGASIRVEKDAAGSGSGPFEKLAILSLLGGVVVLYLSGAQ